MTNEVISKLLLDLWQYSRELTVAEFQGRALERLAQALPFDSAWWGVAQPDNIVHSSFPFRLPADYGEFYQRWVSDTDSLASAGYAAGGTTVHFGAAELAASPGLRLLMDVFGLRQALATVTRIPHLNLWVFLSLYRHSSTPAFSEAERQLNSLVMPHITATWNNNWITQFAHFSEHGVVSRLAHGIADQLGVLHKAEARFLELLHEEWPAWEGPMLPEPLRGRVSREHVGQRVILRQSPVSGLVLIEARLRCVLDTLSPREITIAAAFARGQSYKEVARQVQAAPATVRHHLRSIYSKLGISDKLALAALVQESAAAGRPDIRHYAAHGQPKYPESLEGL
jgi:DNA-binding CsgD family transcriptional regulator